MDAVLPGYRNQLASYRLRIFLITTITIIANVTRHLFKFLSLYSFSQRLSHISSIYVHIIPLRYLE